MTKRELFKQELRSIAFQCLQCDKQFNQVGTYTSCIMDDITERTEKTFLKELMPKLERDIRINSSLNVNNEVYEKMLKIANDRMVKILSNEVEFKAFLKSNNEPTRVQQTMTSIQKEIIQTAINEIKKSINIDIDLNILTIKFVSELPNKWGGSYNPITKTIKIKETKIPYITMTMLVHELGHYLHDIKFNYKKFRIPIRNKSEYAKLNFMEDFAEAFKNYVCGSNKVVIERNAKIKKIFNL